MVVEKEGKIVYAKVNEAKTFWQRFRGLMGRTYLGEGEGLWFENCSAIHCFFMKMPIDVVYCDKNYKVVGVETISPWKIGHRFKGACHVLEVGSGTTANIQTGDVLQIRR